MKWMPDIRAAERSFSELVGASWAKTQGRFGAGYGTLYFAYVKKYGIEAFA